MRRMPEGLWCLGLFFGIVACGSLAGKNPATANTVQEDTVLYADSSVKDSLEMQSFPVYPRIDSNAYQLKLLALANGDSTGRWPVSNQPFPLPGAILPKTRIVAFYGNLESKKMGILGELPPDSMLARLDVEVSRWRLADSTTPAAPALHYIAVMAQGEGGSDGKYRKRMGFEQVIKVLNLAKKRDALVFLDIQVALSTLKEELPLLDTFLMLPQVQLGIDPEFSMKDGTLPGKKIGYFNADDINLATEHLARLVRKYHLPPKVLVIHRFTQAMVKGYRQIRLRPEVQIVVDMDGWGPPVLKMETYLKTVYKEPVQFTGIKLFYKNDIKSSPKRMLSAKEVLSLTPAPSYIQYQ